jgi:hypothetical protein
MQNKVKLIRPLLALFAVITGFSIAGKSMLQRLNIDQDLLLFGNILLLLVTLCSFLLLTRGVYSANPNAFVRSMYGSFILKFFVIAIAAFVYIQLAQKAVNKPALIACMLLYIVYTFIEVSILLKLLKQKKNA